MWENIIICSVFVVGIASSAQGTDLYRVLLAGENDAAVLRNAVVEPVAAIYGGYLVLAEPQEVRSLETAGIKLELVAEDISRDQLALDLRLDDQNVGRYPLLYEEGGFRIYRLDAFDREKALAAGAVMPVRNENLEIACHAPAPFDKSRLDQMEDLSTLIDQVVMDSLQSYTEALQAFGNRYSGTYSSDVSRDWLADKFVEFGYDSIVIDSFVINLGGKPTECQNVIACKIGNALPEHHVIIGAHRDAVAVSPGADDNGSGSAGVLEIARILKDIPTDLTFVFILFGAEEQGLHGSYHYADEAAARGDSIVYMCNMDMIAYYANTSSAKLYHGSRLTYTELLRDLADSLLGLVAVLTGSSGGSDHYPFLVNGYEATFLHEYIFSSVYHSARDSTTYMSFPYMTKMVKAALATVYTVSETYIPGPELVFDYPDGVPTTLIPTAATVFRVAVSGINGGIPVPGSGRLHYAINGGGFMDQGMDESTPNMYQAVLPALSCGDLIEFYFSAEEVDSGPFYNPDPGHPFRATPATGDSTVFYDDCEQDLGWTISGGLWARGSPTGGGGGYGGPDPVGGYDSPNCYGYNLSGDYTGDMPEYHLTTPGIDCSEVVSVKLRFMRWLGVEQPSYDHAYIRVSTDGVDWTTIWANQAEIADYEWVQQEFDISDLADNQAVLYIRWTMGPTDGSWNYCGWNIDNVEITGMICDAGPVPLAIITETVPDWTVGFPYSQQLIAVGGVGMRSWLDKHDDLAGTGLALSTEGLLSGTPSLTGTISFTAQVNDEENSTVEKPFTFLINPGLEITTVAVANAVAGEPYQFQLLSSGGTGEISWTDKNDDLAGTNLALSSSGLLSGTPAAAALVEFTAMVEDAVGSSDERLFSLTITGSVLCGDADSDDVVNISDAVYIITYVFKGGPAPDPECSGDANDDDALNVSDAVYIVNYIFKGGPPPVDTCCQ